jgi:hypothetical protein
MLRIICISIALLLSIKLKLDTSLIILPFFMISLLLPLGLRLAKDYLKCIRQKFCSNSQSLNIYLLDLSFLFSPYHDHFYFLLLFYIHYYIYYILILLFIILYHYLYSSSFYLIIIIFIVSEFKFKIRFLEEILLFKN